MWWEMFTSFATAYLSYLMQENPDGFKDRVRTQNAGNLLPSYDFIVVGAGSAGSVVASRLSENSNWNVLLVEAGGQENEFSRTPAIFTALANTRYDWNYTTVPQKHDCQAYGGACIYPRGHSLGGSSATNGMMFLRGYRSDYDRWGKDNPGWNFDGVRSYFLKAQNNKMPGITVDGNGDLSDELAIVKSIIEGGQELGLKNGKCMDDERDCIERVPASIRDGSRWSASTAYLESPSATRKNLHIITEARVVKITMEGTTARGIEFISNRQNFNVEATREVIVSTGVVDSPKLLMLSGIGPKDQLESLGIKVIADLPVGNNFHDHGFAFTDLEVSHGTWTIDDYKNGMDAYVKSHAGPLSSNGYAIVGYSSLGKPGRPVVQFLIGVVSASTKKTLSIGCSVMRPESRGTIRLNSSDPIADPLIDINYYSKENDFKLTLAGLKEVIKLFKTSALKSYNATVIPIPLCTKTDPLDAFLKCLMRSYTDHGHSVGTVKMAPKNKGGVVDSKLKVYGIQNLRVIDASIAPSVISVNTNSMAIMIGEKGADIIKGDHKKLLAGL